jgi:formaldehyde-activating enzyme involved in methanogenesis
MKRSELDQNARAVVERYGRMFTSGQRKFYGTTEQAVRAAARELIAEHVLPPDKVDGAVKVAIEFIERGAC